MFSLVEGSGRFQCFNSGDLVGSPHYQNERVGIGDLPRNILR